MRIVTMAMLASLGLTPILGCSDEPEVSEVTPEVRAEQEKAQEAVDVAERQMQKNVKNQDR